MLPIITISREVGSGGHSIGKMVADQLGIPFYDRDIIEQVVVSTGYDVKKIEDKGEFASMWDKYLNARFYNGLYIGDDQDKIFSAQKKVILDLAQKGPCVIVGRCADAILAENNIPSLNVFVHADLETRIKRSNLDEKTLVKKDKGRQYYYRFYTEREWGDYPNYHLNLDSGYLGLDACADIIAQVAQNKE
ncbi:MAG: cytidylate kinase-like family protein [Bacillota bacterium]|nr:cytidylate kinase-like family protein [Bacillota bacterium]